ncbi:MAG: hypothetical protein AB1736_03810 [Chloroflexota bacterium]
MSIAGSDARRGDGLGKGRRSRVAALAAAVVAPGLVALPWLGLSVATGLVYHLLPGATFLAAAWAYRAAGGGRPAPLRDMLVALAASAGVTEAGLLVIPVAGGTIADPAELIAVSVGGAVAAVAWLRRPRMARTRARTTRLARTTDAPQRDASA